MYLNEQIQNKWAAVLDHPDAPSFKDSHRRAVTAQLLENTEAALQEAGSFAPQSLFETSDAAPVNVSGGSLNYDPVLISLIRRAMPNLVAYDFCGVQPMTGPTGLIFALRPQYGAQYTSATDPQGANTAFYFEANTAWSSITGANTTIGQGGYDVGGG